MAWTAPRTWVDGELVTAAIMNPHVRDNLNAVKHLIARKTADESVVSSTVLQDDNHLIVPLLANEVWLLEYHLIYTASGGSAGIKLGFTFTSGTIALHAVQLSTTGALLEMAWTGTSSPATETLGPSNGLGDDPIGVVRPGHVWGVFSNGGSAGNLTLQWAQAVSDGTACVMKANSSIWGMKLA